MSLNPLNNAFGGNLFLPANWTRFLSSEDPRPQSNCLNMMMMIQLHIKYN